MDSAGEHVWTQQLAAQWYEKAMARKAIVSLPLHRNDAGRDPNVADHPSMRRGVKSPGPHDATSRAEAAPSSLLVMSVAVLCTLLFHPPRWLLRRLSLEPETGPQVSPGENHFVQWKATMAADGDDVGQLKVMGVMRMKKDVSAQSSSPKWA